MALPRNIEKLCALYNYVGSLHSPIIPPQSQRKAVMQLASTNKRWSLMRHQPLNNVLAVVDGWVECRAGLDPLSVEVHSTQRTAVTGDNIVHEYSTCNMVRK